MSAEQLVAEGLVLMLVGMGTVFVFLTALVLATVAMSRLLARFPDAVATVETVAPRPSSAPTGDVDLVAVIAAALHRHRQGPARRRDKSS